jgi:hypothetical protein
MDDAGLDGCFREDGQDRLGKALQAIDDRDQDVLDAPVLGPCLRTERCTVIRPCGSWLRKWAS